MALPPTPLTTLLYSAPTADAMYEALDTEKCLSVQARTRRSEVIAMISSSIERTTARYAAQPGLTGPTAVDEIARELAGSPYLNSRGKQMCQSGPDMRASDSQPWWHFWK